MAEYIVNYEIYANGVVVKWGNGASTLHGEISANGFRESFCQNVIENTDVDPSVTWRDVRIIGVFRL